MCIRDESFGSPAAPPILFVSNGSLEKKQPSSRCFFPVARFEKKSNIRPKRSPPAAAVARSIKANARFISTRNHNET